MGDWIKENKFEAGLLFVVLLAAVGAFLIGGKQGEKYDQAKLRYDDNVRQLGTLEGKSPYPNAGNVEDYEEEVADYRDVVQALQDKLLAYRPADFTQITPADFTDKLNARREALGQRYTTAGIEFPGAEWQLGFERYTTTPPRDDATAFLSYQLDAHDWLFGALADVRPTELVNVVRRELPVERGESMDGDEDDRRRGNEPVDPYYVLPLELTFKAPEPAVRDFLGKLAGNDRHFFVIRVMRIQNEKRDKPPEKDDVDFQKKAPAGETPFDRSFELIVPEEEETPDGETPAPEGEAPAPGGEEPLFPTEPAPAEPPPADEGEEAGGDRILGQILGGEEIYVFLQLDLLLFKSRENSGLPIDEEAEAAGDS